MEDKEINELFGVLEAIEDSMTTEEDASSLFSYVFEESVIKIHEEYSTSKPSISVIDRRFELVVKEI